MNASTPNATLPFSAPLAVVGEGQRPTAAFIETFRPTPSSFHPHFGCRAPHSAPRRDRRSRHFLS
ncbi:hypothetical protein EII14_04830 [Alloprevotella sp. OH1205_COT-284]|uniref:hypothetical protein n=1 Tax=Alloprevotella sp. OH1205_COT-284 TaxID=2491043 RepID=UPI000F5E7EE4|nr:hypothetical protein [Alloprevotella sp. OH1205_COT-284]RRD79914.1 hypothetical protein EII14_04830 [Alloprevotella sp. OH1205_COT-284]